MGVKPIHVMSPAERTKLPEVTDFFIDLGMSKEEVEKYVSVGDSVTRERDLVEMGDCVNVKSWTTAPDATYSLKPSAPSKASKETLLQLRGRIHRAGGSGPERRAGRHAGHPAGLLHRAGRHHRLRHSRHPAHDQVSRLGEGATIKLYDGSIIADRRMVQFAKATAEANKIKWQVEMLPAGGTDAGAMQKFVPGGSIAGAISVPTRNVHQVIEMASKSDLGAAVDLLAACAMNVGQVGLVLELRQSMPERLRQTGQGIQGRCQDRQSRRQEKEGQVKPVFDTSLNSRPHPGTDAACFMGKLVRIITENGMTGSAMSP